MLTSHEVMARLDGRISYRQLDYWVRTGRVRLDERPRPGSGNRRLFSEVEVDALIELVALNDRVVELSTLIADGTAFAQLVERHTVGETCAHLRTRPDFGGGRRCIDCGTKVEVPA